MFCNRNEMIDIFSYGTIFRTSFWYKDAPICIWILQILIPDELSMVQY